MIPKPAQDSGLELASALQEGRGRTLELIADLTDEQMMGPVPASSIPCAGSSGTWRGSRNTGSCAISARNRPPDPRATRFAILPAFPDTRWDLALPSKAETLAYAPRILDRVLEKHGPAGPEASRRVDGYDQAYFIRLALLREYMHAGATPSIGKLPDGLPTLTQENNASPMATDQSSRTLHARIVRMN
jgi:hypothetical protein